MRARLPISRAKRNENPGGIGTGAKRGAARCRLMADEQRDDVEDLKAADAKDVHRAVREEGEKELARPAASLTWSALAAGLAINASLVAMALIDAAVPDAPAKPLLVALGYPIGFVIVVLGRMQFFTESTVTAMLPLVHRPSLSGAARTLRLWGIVLGANLVGTLFTTGVLVHGGLVDPAVAESIAQVSGHSLRHDPLHTFLAGIPAGFLVAGIAWLLPNGREQAFLVVFAITWLVGAAGFAHSVVGSAEAWALAWSGHIGWTDALFAKIAPAVAGNLVGGAGLFTLLAHGQVQGEEAETNR
jgi:formate/nitrite transporter FocA (FNT family)